MNPLASLAPAIKDLASTQKSSFSTTQAVWRFLNNNKISFSKKIKKISISNITTKTLAFTYLNPHVYSDTVFFLGNFSKNFLLIDKFYFGIGASIASFIFFFILGYSSKLLSNHLQSDQIWKRINLFIIIFMSIIALYILIEILNFF